MRDIAIGVIVRPLTVIVLLLSAVFIARGLRRLIPEGRLKKILYKRLS